MCSLVASHAATATLFVFRALLAATLSTGDTHLFDSRCVGSVGALVGHAEPANVARFWEEDTIVTGVVSFTANSGTISQQVYPIAFERTLGLPGSDDDTAIEWDLRTMRAKRTYKGHTDWVKSVEPIGRVKIDRLRIISFHSLTRFTGLPSHTRL